MKLKATLLCGLLLTGANAMACFTVYDGSNRVIYRGADAPVDMSLPLHQAVAQRFPAGSSLVFDQTATCTPVSIAQVARPTGAMVPPNTLRMERTGRTVTSPSSSASPLLTDRQTAQRNNLPHTVIAGDIVMVPAQAAARLDLPSFTVIPADVAVARAPVGPNTSVLGGPAGPDTVITEMRDPPMTIIQRGGRTTVQR
ncbi:MAG: hypothetical protein EOO30_20830 [Comamonadaceae bacterium]|nr:MAG: hypothetical protein EOO30_20830 [Comamonadaceae bacterium]